MKKLVSLLFLTLILAVSSLLLFACGHEHVYSVWEMEKAVTCVEEGLSFRVCKCGKKEVMVIPATGHTDGEWVIDKNATCTEDGVKTQSCSACKEILKTESFSLSASSATDIYNKASAAVGEIITYDKYGDEYSIGTGFVYKTYGQIITNYHVIEDAISAKITIGASTYTIESVLAYDKTIDLAVLKISASNLPVLKMCTKEHKVGTVVYAMGSSKGLTATFSEGIITYSNRVMDGVSYVQHDAAISSGNSGGPLINQYNEVIGINTLTIKDSQNLNFAISTSEISSLKFGNPITLKELFGESEAGSTSATRTFIKMKNYIISKGTYSSYDREYTMTLGYSHSSDYSSKYTRKAVYDVEDDTIFLQFYIDNSNILLLSLTEETIQNGAYAWGYTDSYGYQMLGTVTAASFNSNTMLGYVSTNIYSSSMITTVRRLASAMLGMLMAYFDIDFTSIGVDTWDLSFYNF